LFLMRKQKKSRPKSAKGERYKVTNWSEYNRSLKKRGSITFWLSEDVCSKWYYEGQSQRGAQQEYSDTCIELCCIVRKVYHLPLRQTEGLLESIIHLAGLELKTPDYSVICRRSKKLAVQLPGKIKHGAYLDVVFDSTGLKVFGEGEWKVRQHGWGKHRTWRKVHIGADPSTGLIQAAAMSTNSITDATMVKPLLRQIKGKVKKFTGDGGYDKMKVYAELERLKIKPVIPPQKNARIRKHGNCKGRTNPRDRTIRFISAHGRKKWKRTTHYHKRSLAENIMYRYKTILGDKLQARTPERQCVETLICCKILNKINLAGMPVSQKVRHKN
jgi:hypothetical protein